MKPHYKPGDEVWYVLHNCSLCPGSPGGVVHRGIVQWSATTAMVVLGPPNKAGVRCLERTTGIEYGVGDTLESLAWSLSPPALFTTKEQAQAALERDSA